MVNKKEINNTIALIVGVMFLTGFVGIVFPTLKDVMVTYFFLLGIPLIVYGLSKYQDNVIGISKKNLTRSILFALILGGGFWVITKIVPGFSMGLPIVPQAISDQMRAFVIIIIAPVVETLLVQGALLAYVSDFNPSKKGVRNAIIIQAIFFALMHLTAYISGFYNYPSFVEAYPAVIANIGSFVAAFFFALVAGFFVVKDGIRNLIFVMIFHSLINLIILTSLAVVFI